MSSCQRKKKRQVFKGSKTSGIVKHTRNPNITSPQSGNWAYSRNCVKICTWNL